MEPRLSERAQPSYGLRTPIWLGGAGQAPALHHPLLAQPEQLAGKVQSFIVGLGIGQQQAHKAHQVRAQLGLLS